MFPLGSPWLWTKHTRVALQLQLTQPGGVPVVTVIADVGEKKLLLKGWKT